MKAIAMLFAAAALALPAAAQERSIQKEVVVKAPPEAVWKSWTTPDGIVSFFAPEAVLDIKPDGLFDIHMNPYAEPGLRGADNMRVMGVQENRMLTFTWNAPPHLAEARAQRTFVIVRLADVDGKSTRVTLHHTGWGAGGEWDKTFAYFDRAWGYVLGNLKKRHDVGPQDWTEWMANLRKAHAAASAPK